MKKRVFVIEGLAFLLIGLIFLLNSFSSITGAVVLENVNVNISGLLGLVFVVVGLVVMMSGKKLEERLYDLKSRDRKRLYFEIAAYMGRRPLTGAPTAGAYGHRYMDVDAILNSRQIKNKIKGNDDKTKKGIILEAIELLKNRGELNYSGPKDIEDGGVSINLGSARRIIEYYEKRSRGDETFRKVYESFTEGLKKLIHYGPPSTTTHTLKSGKVK